MPLTFTMLFPLTVPIFSSVEAALPATLPVRFSVLPATVTFPESVLLPERSKVPPETLVVPP